VAEIVSNPVGIDGRGGGRGLRGELTVEVVIHCEWVDATSYDIPWGVARIDGIGRYNLGGNERVRKPRFPIVQG
jgi:hypothetical protein